MRELGNRIVTGRAAYVVVGIVFVAAVLMVWLGHDQLKQAGGQTLTASLLGFLTTFMLDVNAKERERVEKQHEAERAKLTQQLEHAFAVGSSSHMANVAFDRHVKFCEDYAGELRRTIETLIREASTEKAVDHAVMLRDLRRAQALWLTAEMEEPLEKVEQALSDMGTAERRLQKGRHSDAMRGQLIDQVERLFDHVTGIAPKETLNKEIAISNVVRELGRVLGVEDLTRLRLKILKNAAGSSGGS